MSHRHLSRSIVLQTLYALDTRGFHDADADQILEQTIGDFGIGMDNTEFVTNLVAGIIHKRVIIDEIIEKAAPQWPIINIPLIDRNVLRMGLYELLFGDREHVPPKVAINEAIEMAKVFGGQNSSRFVNGVLGTVYREIGEPGKDQVSKEKDSREIPTDEKGAALVYAYDTEGVLQLGMVHDVFGYWTLSKGSIEAGESLEEGTQREVKEEIGLDVIIESKLGENEYIANHPQRGKVRKHVTYFLAQAEYQPLVLESGTGGLDDARWFPATEISDLTMYEDITQIIMHGIEKILAK
jgi:transcription antitermination protein NusB